MAGFEACKSARTWWRRWRCRGLPIVDSDELEQAFRLIVKGTGSASWPPAPFLAGHPRGQLMHHRIWMGVLQFSPRTADPGGTQVRLDAVARLSVPVQPRVVLPAPARPAGLYGLRMPAEPGGRDAKRIMNVPGSAWAMYQTHLRRPTRRDRQRAQVSGSSFMGSGFRSRGGRRGGRHGGAELLDRLLPHGGIMLLRGRTVKSEGGGSRSRARLSRGPRSSLTMRAWPGRRHFATWPPGWTR